MKEHTDEECLQILEYLSSHPNGQVSDLRKLGYKFDLINSLQFAGLLAIYQVGSKDHHGRYEITDKYKMTDTGTLYAKIVL